jgi:hypothetical protein
MEFQLNNNRQYYRVESGLCWDALVDWRNRRQEADKQCFEFAKSVGGVGFYAGNDENVGNALAVAAIIFEGKLPSGWKQRRWSSFQNIREGTVAGWPDQRTIAGKAALKRIKALPLRPSSYRVCDAIGFPGAVNYSNATSRGSSALGFWETMHIGGWLRDTFYVGLPKLDEEIAKMEAKGYTVDTPRWTPVEGMVPILKEEMDLDFARAKLRDAA